MTPERHEPAYQPRPASHRGVVIYVVIAVLALAAIGIGVGYWYISSNGGGESADQTGPQWATVRSEKIPIVVVAEGELVAKDQLDVLNLIDHPDDERIETIVEEGTWVEEGTLLYTLNAPGLVSDRDEWQSRVREAEADLNEAEQNLEIEKVTAESAEAKAKLELELSHLAFKQWEQGEHPQKVRDLNLAKEKAERELEQATRELAASKELYAKGYISRTELEDDEIRLIEAKNAMTTAKQNIDIYEKYEKVKARKEVESDIKQAEEELARTKEKNRNKQALMQAKIDSAKNELDQRKLRLADLERMVRAMSVKAERSGTVIYASTIGVGWEKYRIIRPGAGLRGGQRVMVLSNTSQMVANLYVHESRINEIRRGQQVSIKVNARPDMVFPATIIGRKKSAVQDGSNANPHLRQYMVIAEMDSSKLTEDIQPGMNCSAEIAIREIPETLAVPIQAVHTEGDKHFVYISAEGGKVRRKLVRVGGSSDTLVQVTKGLEEGARVLLRNPEPGEELPLSAAEEREWESEVVETAAAPKAFDDLPEVAGAVQPGKMRPDARTRAESRANRPERGGKRPKKER